MARGHRSLCERRRCRLSGGGGGMSRGHQGKAFLDVKYLVAGMDGEGYVLLIEVVLQQHRACTGGGVVVTNDVFVFV